MKDKITIKKRTIKIFDHSTSISLENIFWDHLKIIADNNGTTVSKILENIDLTRIGNLSSNIRVYVFKYFINIKN